MNSIVKNIINNPSQVKPKVEESNDTTNNIYDDLGIVAPFTVLAGSQFNSFIGELSKHGMLSQTEQEAFTVLWYAAGVDIGGTGNNLWNLKKGSFEIYNNNGIAIKFEKKCAEVKNKYSDDNSRTNFVYSSKDGSFVISQNDRNQKIFLVYVSKDITGRLLKVLRDAEAKALEIEKVNTMTNGADGIPNTTDFAITSESTGNVESNEEVSETRIIKR